MNTRSCTVSGAAGCDVQPQDNLSTGKASVTRGPSRRKEWTRCTSQMEEVDYALQLTALYGAYCILRTIWTKLRAGRYDSGSSRLQLLLKALARTCERLKLDRQEMQNSRELDIVKHVGTLMQRIRRMSDLGEGSFFRRMCYAGRITASLEEVQEFVILYILIRLRLHVEPTQDVGSTSVFPQPLDVSSDPPPRTVSPITTEEQSKAPKAGAHSDPHHDQPHKAVHIIPEHGEFPQGADSDPLLHVVISITAHQSELTRTDGDRDQDPPPHTVNQITPEQCKF